jgi:hypothetical protein
MAKTDKKVEGGIIGNFDVEGKVDDKYVPEGFDSQEDFLKDMRYQYEQDVEFDRTNREQALDDKKFAAGEQWDPVVLEQRKGLPCLVINNIPQFTAQLVGDWRESRKAIKVVPSNDEDSDIASVRGDLIRSIEMQSRASRVYDTAFESLVQCGDGAFRVAVEYARDDVFDQDIFLRPIEDCLATVWDRYSVDPTGRDAKRVFVNDKIAKKEYDKKWKDKTPTELGCESELSSLSQGWVEDDSYRITEYWRLIERQRLLAMFSNGKIYEISATNQQSLIEQYGNPVKIRAAWCSFAQMHLVTGFAILSGPYEYRLNRLPIIRMSGRVVNVGGRRIRYGLVRFMKDAVRLKNFWRSIAAEQLGYAPKAKWIAPESAVEGREDAFRKAHMSRDPLLIYNDGAESPPELIPPPPVEASLLNEAAVNQQDMKDVTGIHDASLGIKSNETSGRAIMARQKEGDVASLTFYDNGDAAVLEAGDVINQLIPQIYDGTRVIRRIGEDESQKFQRVNDPMNPDSIDLSVGQFDVALSTGTSYTTRRVEAAQSMMDAIQVWPQLMQIAGDLVVKAQDWPGADKLAERLKKTVPPQFLDPEEQQQNGGPVPTPEQIQEAMVKMQELEAENQELKSTKILELKKLEIDAYNAATQRIRALSDNEVDGNQMEMDAIKHILDVHSNLDDQEIRQQELQLSSEQSERQHELQKSTLAAKAQAAAGNKSQSASANG